MELIDNIVWYVATIFLVGSGIYYSIKLKFPQFHFKRIFSSLKNDKTNNKGISPFETLTLALAARIGVGSLSGIALGIYKGGPGIIFWVWVSCILTLPNSLVESTLAVKYHEKDNEFYKGGPAYYIKNGLNNKNLSIIYAVLITVCYLIGFLGIQSNTIASNMFNFYNVPKLLVGIFVGILTFVIIFKGLKSITNFTSKLVPIMGIIYVGFSLYIVLNNITLIPGILLKIVKSAFNIKTFGWGTFASIIVIGVQRGIFSSECGIGTGAIASGASEESKPIKQGYLQMLGIYFTTFIVCTSTALIILTSKVNINSFIDPNGIEITTQALMDHLGSLGKIVMLLAIVAFAFSTIISGYYYGENNLKFLNNKIKGKYITLLKLFVVLILVISSIISPSIIWTFIDILLALSAIVNIIALIKLRKEMINEYNHTYKFLGIFNRKS